MTTKADFRFLGEIGRGSFGKVEKVLRKSDGKVCVCKQIPLSTMRSKKQREQALNETMIMRQLNCPFIVEYLDTFLEKDSLCIILQFCSGGNLDSFLKKAKVLPNRSIWRYLLHIAFGLQYLHAKRILHRDIKSENIFLHGPDEGLRVGDLGLSRVLSNVQSCASTLVGTPRYMAPEEAKGLGKYNDKSDVWSLGVILYELCSDRHRGPFSHASNLPALMQAILEEDPPALPQRVEELQEVCSVLLEKDAFQRPSIAQLLALQSSVEAIEKHEVLNGNGASADKNSASLTSVPEASDDSIQARLRTSLTRAMDSGELARAVAVVSLNQSKGEHSGMPQTASTAARGANVTGAESGGAPGEGAPPRQVSPVVEEPDGLWSRIAKTVGLTTGESDLGPRFKRRAFCEICHAEAAERSEFGPFHRRHHCRSCGSSVCSGHSPDKRSLPQLGYWLPQRICEICSHMPVDIGSRLDSIAEVTGSGSLVDSILSRRSQEGYNSYQP